MFYKNTIELSDKIYFINIFAKLADKFTNKNTYANLIAFFNTQQNSSSELKNYLNTKIAEYQGIVIIPKNDEYRALDTYRETRSLECTAEIKELNLLLSNLKKDHILIKLFYHLTVLKVICMELQSSEYGGCDENESMNLNPYLYEVTQLPFVNLDFDSTENSQVINEVDAINKKFPSLLLESSRNNKGREQESRKLLSTLEDASNEFIKSFLIRANNESIFVDYFGGKLTLNNMPFLEFDKDFFKNKLLSLKNEDYEDCIIVSSTSASFGSCESGYDQFNLTVVALDLNTFAKKHFA